MIINVILLSKVLVNPAFFLRRTQQKLWLLHHDAQVAETSFLFLLLSRK